MFKIAIFFLFNLQLMPDLIDGRFITFQNDGYFYIIDEEDIYDELLKELDTESKSIH